MTRDEFEQNMRDAGRSLAVSFTLADRNGVFRTPDGERLIGAHLGTHQKHTVCALHFSPLCIQHCRYEVDEAGASADSAFVHRCWKNVCEIVFPLKRCDVLFGLLFAGVWRWGESPPEGLSRKFEDSWWLLPVLSPDRERELRGVMNLLGRGLLDVLEESRSLQFEGGQRKVEIRQFLHYNAGKRVGLKELGQQLNLSPSRAGHVVRELFGCGLMQLLTQERLLRARILLRSSDMSVREVAAQAGFADACHFGRVFKSATGTTPLSYRADATGRE